MPLVNDHKSTYELLPLLRWSDCTQGWLLDRLIEVNALEGEFHDVRILVVLPESKNRLASVFVCGEWLAFEQQ